MNSNKKFGWVWFCRWCSSTRSAFRIVVNETMENYANLELDFIEIEREISLIGQYADIIQIKNLKISYLNVESSLLV